MGDRQHPGRQLPREADIAIEPRYAGPDDVLLDVTLTPTPARLEPLTFAIGLGASPGSVEWLVYYWVPQYGDELAGTLTARRAC